METVPDNFGRGSGQPIIFIIPQFWAEGKNLTLDVSKNFIII